MKILFFLIILTGFFASAHKLELKPNGFLNLDTKKWVFGKGSFTPNTLPVNLYSNKTAKDEQIVYEDLFLVKDVINERVPKECQGKFNIDEVEKSASCKFSKDEKDINKYSFTVISLFKTSAPNVYRVRSTFFIGEKKRLAELEGRVDSILNTASHGKRTK